MGLWAKGIAPKDIASKAASIKAEVQDSLRSDGSFGTKTASKSERMFNDRGELNASSKSEAFLQGEKFANSYRNAMQIKTASKLKQSEIEEMFASAYQNDDKASLMRFANDVAPLILERLDFQGCIRQIFHTHEVQQGQIIGYERDINVRAITMHGDGSVYSADVKGDRVFPHEFWITAKPEVAVQETLVRQFDILQRVYDKTTFQIQLQEDRKGFKLLYDAAEEAGNTVEITGAVDKGVLEDLSATIETEQLIMDKYIMNRSDYGDLKKGMNAFEFDPVTSREMLMSGMLATFWGKPILVGAGVDRPGQDNNAIPKGMVWATTEGRYLGYMPIRLELQATQADKFLMGEFKYSWLFGEYIGMIVTNPRAVACGIKSGAVIPAWMK
jgi:hypothetical protein